MQNQPENWPSTAPSYHSLEGWEFEKQAEYKRLKAMLTVGCRLTYGQTRQIMAKAEFKKTGYLVAGDTVEALRMNGVINRLLRYALNRSLRNYEIV